MKKNRLFFLVIAIFFIGTLSTLFSKNNADNVSAKWLQSIMNNRTFFVHQNYVSKNQINLLKNANVEFTIYTKNKSESTTDGFPWGYIDNAKFEFPFVLSNEYGYCYAPTQGNGGKRYYFCFFGLVIYLTESTSWAA